MTTNINGTFLELQTITATTSTLTTTTAINISFAPPASQAISSDAAVSTAAVPVVFLVVFLFMCILGCSLHLFCASRKSGNNICELLQTYLHLNRQRQALKLNQVQVKAEPVAPLYPLIPTPTPAPMPALEDDRKEIPDAEEENALAPESVAMEVEETGETEDLLPLVSAATPLPALGSDLYKDDEDVPYECQREHEDNMHFECVVDVDAERPFAVLFEEADTERQICGCSRTRCNMQAETQVGTVWL